MNKRPITILTMQASPCALPIYALITGVISLSAIAAVFTSRLMEMIAPYRNVVPTCNNIGVTPWLGSGKPWCDSLLMKSY
jgi:hypothetical protein